MSHADVPVVVVARDPYSLMGQAGAIFDGALKAVGVTRNAVRLAYLSEGVGALRTTRPQVVLALGVEAAKATVGDQWPDDSLQAVRGYLWDTAFGRVVATMAPAEIVTNWSPWRALLDYDVRRAFAEARAGAPPLTEREVTVVTTAAELNELCTAVARSDLLSVDIENTQDLQLACVGFAPTSERAWVIPAITRWQTEAIRELCESGVPKVLQNGQYDRLFLRRFCGITLRNQTADAMLAWHALNPELAGKKTQVGNRKAGARRTVKSLKFLASIYTRDRYWKDYAFTSDMERYALCGKDVCVTLEIANKQMKQLADSGLRAIHDFEVELLEPCIAMTERGMPVDDARRREMIARLDREREPMIAELERYVTETVLGAHADRLNGKAHLFRKRTVCKCCRNGKGKRDACWACAGWEKKPTRKQETALVDAGTPLTSCAKCAGAGATERAVFNPASPEQVKIVLYDLLRLPKRTKDGKLTTDEEALKSLLADADAEAREFITRLLRLGKMDTMRAILVRIAPAEDGRIRTTYNPAGTETGRFSSAETFLVESTNLQNMPKREAVDADLDVRSCFVATPGKVLVEADLSGAEAWVTAACCGDTDLLDKLRSGFKIHEWTAAFVLTHGLGRPTEVSAVTESERQVFGKTPRHALNYGMQWSMFMRNVNAVADRTGRAITAREAKGVYSGYHALHPKLSQWWDEVLAKLVTRGTLTTCFGRTRTFYGRNRGERLGEAHREAIAFEPQSTIADLLNRGMLRWWRQHDGKVGELIAQVHDSIIVETTAARGKVVAELVRRCLTETIRVHGIEITIPVDVKVLTSWAAYKAPKPKPQEAVA